MESKLKYSLSEKKYGSVQLVSFLVEGKEMAVGLFDVKEIIQPIEIQPIPRAPKIIEGVINLRNKIIPIIDLRKSFGEISNPVVDQNKRIIVMDLDQVVLGFIVDEVNTVVSILKPEIQLRPPVDFRNMPNEWIRGVIKHQDHLILFVDLLQLFSSDEKHYLSEVE